MQLSFLEVAFLMTRNIHRYEFNKNWVLSNVLKTLNYQCERFRKVMFRALALEELWGVVGL